MVEKHNLQKLFELNATASRLYSVKAKAGEDSADIFVYDMLGGWGIGAEQFAKDVAAIEAKTINLFVNSPGGEVPAARAMMAALRRHEASVMAHVDGLAASAASLLLLAADEVEISPGSFIMIHDPWALTVGDAETHRDGAELLDKYSEAMVRDYSARSGATAKQVREWMSDETWFDADEAVANGFADRVAEVKTKAQASWNLAAFRNAPRALAVCAAVVAAEKPNDTEVQGSAPVQTNKEVSIMVDPTKITGQTQAPDLDAVRAEALAAERTRASEITRIGLAAQMPGEDIQSAVSGNVTVEAWQNTVLAKMVEDSNRHDTRVGAAAATIIRDEADTRRSGFVAALLHRSDPLAFPLKDGEIGAEQRGLVRMGLVRVAEEVARAAGKYTNNMSPSHVVQAAMSTSEFPYLLGAIADTSLKAGYAKQPQSWAPIVGRKTVPNFKLQTILDSGISATFPKVPEGGEFQYGSMTEGKDTFRCFTYGQLIAITRQVIINDELGAFTDIPAKLGQKWAIAQSSLMWGVLTANAALFDGVALFHATHANLVASGTAISVDSLGVMRKTMRAQTDLSGDLIDVTPRYIVVPVGKEQLARQYMSNAFNPTAQSSINPWVGTMEIITEPRLDTASATAWYVFADPAVAPVLIAVGLEGNEGVFSESQYGFEIDGVKFKARMDFGAAAIDYRGAVKNPGA